MLWTAGLLACAVYVIWRTLQFIPWPPALAGFFDLSRFPGQPLPDLLRHWALTFKHAALVAIWVAAAHGLGRWALDAGFKHVRTSRLEQALYALGLGFNIWMLLTFLLGVAGGLRPVWYWGLWLVLSGLGLWRTWLVRRDLRPGPGWLLGSKPAGSDWALAGVVAGFLGLVYLNANAPELFFDSLVYHLAVPAQWILHGGIFPLPSSFFSNLPMNVEMLYTGGLLLGDERLCRLLHATLSLAGGLVVFAMARRWAGRRAGVWAAGIYLTIPLLALNMCESGVDGGSAFYAILACSALADWFFPAKDAVPGAAGRRAALAGWFTGAALGCKYVTAFLLVPAYLAAFAVTGVKKLFQAARFRELAIAGVAALAMTAPWFAKSAVFTHNPVYPFLYKVIPSKHIEPAKMQQQMDGFREYGSRTFIQYLRMPWDMSFFLPTSNSFIGVVYAFLIPGILLLAWKSRRGPPILRFMLLTALLAGGLWASQTQIMRYFLPALALIAIPGAWALDHWEQASRAGRMMRWVALVLMTIAGATLIHMMGAYLDPVGVSLGLEHPQDYFKRKLLNNYAAAAETVNRLPGRPKLLFVGETRSYYFKQPVTAATVYDRDPFIHTLENAASAEAAWNQLKAQGYTHIFINYQEAARVRGYEPYQWHAGSLGRLREFQARYLVKTAEFGQQALFALAEKPDLAQPVKAGRPLFTYEAAVINRVNEHLLRNFQAVQASNLNQSEAELQACIELAPEWDLPYMQLGWLYLRMDRPQDSLTMFRRAHELGRLDPSSLNNLGVLEMQSQRIPEAVAAFRAALAEAPDMAQVRQNLEAAERMLAERKP